VRAFRLRRYFRGGAAVDFGCGGGFTVEAMRRLGAASAAGYDVDRGAIAYAREHHGANTFFCEPLEAFLARGLTFDFGHSSQVIEHVGDPGAFVDAWARVVRPGGVFYLKTPDRAHWRTGEHPEDWPGPPSYVQYFNRYNITQLLDRHGFSVRRVRFNLKPTVELIAVRR
jgi:SAM-dependent methyltransferase